MSINYHLSVACTSGIRGNRGLLDQVTALECVQRNLPTSVEPGSSNRRRPARRRPPSPLYLVSKRHVVRTEAVHALAGHRARRSFVI
ncbi:hypothetical protein [Rhodococcus erythropolis]|uniref:hypothetical protein n=1 Tax=Rhodococcus erythropolis TaxID=1833 RepID=UPI00211EA1EE|nr:hypothetical protein [Rhodococcus erythropolis]